MSRPTIRDTAFRSARTLAGCWRRGERSYVVRSIVANEDRLTTAALALSVAALCDALDQGERADLIAALAVVPYQRTR